MLICHPLHTYTHAHIRTHVYTANFPVDFALKVETFFKWKSGVGCVKMKYTRGISLK